MGNVAPPSGSMVALCLWRVQPCRLRRGFLLAETQVERDDIVLPKGGCPVTSRYHGTRRTGQRVPSTWHKELRMRISLSHSRVFAIWNGTTNSCDNCTRTPRRHVSGG